MNFQSKLIEKTSEIRERALAMAKLASQEARTRATQAADRLDGLKRPLTTLQLAGRELSKVARRHVSKFVSENSALARAAGKDVSQLAQTAFAELRKPATTVRKRKVSMTRKRVSKKAA